MAIMDGIKAIDERYGGYYDNFRSGWCSKNRKKQQLRQTFNTAEI